MMMTDRERNELLLPSDDSLEDIDADTYWRLDGLDDMHFDVSPPDIELEAILLLDDPAFVGDERFLERLRAIYGVVTEKALDVAYEG